METHVPIGFIVGRVTRLEYIGIIVFNNNWNSIKRNNPYVQSNKKMHDLYATMHIFQMALPDAFWAVWSQIFSLYLSNLNFPMIL